MSFVRVTQGLMVSRVLTNLGRQSRRLLTLQEQLATGQIVNTPSDDPIAARLAIDTRAALGESEQYLGNIQSATPLLTESESEIDSVYENIARLTTLAQQGASDTYNQSQLSNIAVEVNQILEDVLNAANHQTNGRYIFGGTRTSQVPFEATRNAAGEITSVTYQGNDEHTQVAIGEGVRINTNETGQDVFQSQQDLFQTLVDLRDNLRAGNRTALRTNALDELETLRGQLLQSQSRIGAVQNRLERTTDDIEGFVIQYKQLLSDTIDADYSETVINLNAQGNAYEAALNAASRVIQSSLLDYI